MGPVIDVTAIAPWEAHNWEAYVSCEGVMNPKSRNKLVNGLYSSMPNSSMVIICLTGTISNKDQFDDKLVGGAAANVLEGQVRMRIGYTRTMSWCLGTEVTQYDVDLFAIAKAAEWLAAEYSHAPAPHHIYILSSNNSALRHITNSRSHDNQTKVLTWHRSLTTFFSSQRDTSILLVWTPVCWSRSQDSGARRAALQACMCAPLSSLNHVQSASYVKQKARQHMYHQWSTQWQLDHRKSHFCNSPVYDYAITQPPDGRNHPLFTKDIPPKKPADDYITITRCSSCTAMCLATQHSFTSEYTRRHRPNLPPEAQHCPCSFMDRSICHLLYDCTRYESQRTHPLYLRRHMSTVPPEELFGLHAYTLLLFLQKTGAASRPETGPSGPFDPG